MAITLLMLVCTGISVLLAPTMVQETGSMMPAFVPVLAGLGVLCSLIIEVGRR